MPLGRKICGETFAGPLNATVPLDSLLATVPVVWLVLDLLLPVV